MDIVTPKLPVPTFPPIGTTQNSIESRITIPAGIDSLAAHRRSAQSDSYPESGWVSNINVTSGFMELEGTPDVVLEVISKSSKTKDCRDLREPYWKAGINEYWLVDARTKNVRFDILAYTNAGYAETPIEDGWVRSELLRRSLDPLGLAHFIVHVKSIES